MPEPAAKSAAAAASAAGHGALPEDAIVRGVHYRTRDGQHDVRAPLTIAADGRFSRIRRLAGFECRAPPRRWTWSGSGCRAAQTSRRKRPAGSGTAT